MMFAYALSEVRRSVKNRRVLIPSLIMPVLLMLLIGKGKAQVGGLAVASYFMVSMATFGSLSAIMSAGGRVAFERAIGWNRQLRLTALTGRDYVVGKFMTGFVLALGTLLITYLVAASVNNVRLPASEWALSAVAILVAMIPIGVFGIAIGYMAKPDNMQAITGAFFTIISLLGGIFFPLTQMPGWLQAVSKALPVTWSAAAGRDVLLHTWIGWEGVGILIAWTIGLTALAAWAYKRDSFRA